MDVIDVISRTDRHSVSRTVLQSVVQSVVKSVVQSVVQSDVIDVIDSTKHAWCLKTGGGCRAGREGGGGGLRGDGGLTFLPSLIMSTGNGDSGFNCVIDVIDSSL